VAANSLARAAEAQLARLFALGAALTEPPQAEEPRSSAGAPALEPADCPL